MAKITGIGGVFLNEVSDVAKLLDWYQDVMGLDVTEYGINFPDQKGMPLITFHRKADEAVMLNFAVEDLEGFCQILKDKGVQFKGEMETFHYGKFVRIFDPLEREIELCELNEKVYREMVMKEIEDYKSKKA